MSYLDELFEVIDRKLVPDDAKARGLIKAVVRDALREAADNIRRTFPDSKDALAAADLTDPEFRGRVGATNVIKVEAHTTPAVCGECEKPSETTCRICRRPLCGECFTDHWHN